MIHLGKKFIVGNTNKRVNSQNYHVTAEERVNSQ